MILDQEIRAFLMGGVSIVLASRNVQLVPSTSRAIGCRVIDAATPRLRLIVSREQAGEFLDDVLASGMISATFSLPNTHRSMQFKGTDAVLGAANDVDRDISAKYVDAFAAVVGPFGFAREFVRTFFACVGDEIAIEFTPCDAFEQTPGPDAGARLQ